MTDQMYNIVSFSDLGAGVSAGYYMTQVGLWVYRWHTSSGRIINRSMTVYSGERTGSMAATDLLEEKAGLYDGNSFSNYWI